MLEGRREDRRQVVTRLGHGGFQAGHVVVVTENLVGPVRVDRAGRTRHAPGGCAMIGALGPDHFLAPRMGPGRRQRHGGGVGAVLAEDRPVSVGDHGRQRLGQLHHKRRRSRQRIALTQLTNERRVDFGMAISEQVRAVGAHEIQIAVAVHIGDVGAVTPREELRIVIRQEPDRLMSEHPARDNRLGPLPQLPIPTVRPAHPRLPDRCSGELTPGGGGVGSPERKAFRGGKSAASRRGTVGEIQRSESKDCLAPREKARAEFLHPTVSDLTFAAARAP